MEYNFTFREKDKGFQVILSYKDNRGCWKQKSKQGFKTKREAKIAGDKLLEEVKANAPIYMDNSIDSITFGEFTEMYLNNIKRNIAYNTLRNYRQAIKAFSDLETLKLINITHNDIVVIFNSLNYKASTANMYLAKIKNIFKKAVSPYKLLIEDPSVEITPRKINGPQKINALTRERLNFILERVKTRNNNVYIICCIAAFSGLRLGEIMGLKWSDINFVNGTITVERQLTRDANNSILIKPLKTNNSYRTVPAPIILLEILKKYRQASALHISGLIFWNINYLTPVNILRGLNENVNIHLFRHTYATTLLANGVDIKTVAALIGDTVATVSKTYIHYNDDMRKNASRAISQIFLQ
jgi:integrase|nr:MAG TPA: Integrase [Caudoviricetes sp.]